MGHHLVHCTFKFKALGNHEWWVTTVHHSSMFPDTQELDRYHCRFGAPMIYPTRIHILLYFLYILIHHIYIYIIYILLVGGLEHLFFHILGIIIPTDVHIFQRDRYTTHQIILYIYIYYIILNSHIHGYESKPWYLVNPKIAGKWMFIPLKMVLIGIDPYPYYPVLCP